MGILSKKAPVAPVKQVSLLTQLDAKADVLAADSSNKQSIADGLIQQAGQLREEAKVNAAHAEAVVKAVAILDEAGVKL